MARERRRGRDAIKLMNVFIYTFINSKNFLLFFNIYLYNDFVRGDDLTRCENLITRSVYAKDDIFAYRFLTGRR